MNNSQFNEIVHKITREKLVRKIKKAIKELEDFDKLYSQEKDDSLSLK